MNGVIENILSRRSVRKFTAEKISDGDLRILCDCAAHAPSGMNAQSWKFTVLTDKKTISDLAEVIGRLTGRSGYDFYKPTAMIIASNRADNPNGFADCCCALQNIFLAAHSMGIGSVWINQLKDIQNIPEGRKALSSLNIPENHIIVGTAALGYAAAEPSPKTVKSDVSEFVDNK